MPGKFKLKHGTFSNLMIMAGRLGLPPDFQGYFNFFSISDPLVENVDLCFYIQCDGSC